MNGIFFNLSGIFYKSRLGGCLGCFGGGATPKKKFLGMEVPVRAKTTELKNDFFFLGFRNGIFLVMVKL